METTGSKRSYALIWCMPNNDDDDAPAVLVNINEDIFCPNVVVRMMGSTKMFGR